MPALRIAAILFALVLAACTREGQPGDSPDRYSELYAQLHPSVVLITMQIPADDPKRKGKWDEAYGSGAIVASGTWGSRILTDAHVIADARDLRAKTGDAGRAVPLRVVAVSNDDDDLALLEIPTPNLKPIVLGSMRTVVPGRAIGVLGYPIPDAFEDEHLRSVVSLYTGRIASVRNGTMEIDVPIIPGESGGPVFDARSGAVIGIAESRFDDERAIGFATPVDVIARFLAAHPRR
ncbi:MAG TPA: serine protease [Candidatus Lustribacter sp.]